MMLSTRRIIGTVLVTALAGARIPATYAQGVPHATVVYAVGKDPALPIPFFTRTEEANEDVADQLFLHLAT
ncbi:MAG: hypothetical protein ACREK8_09530, partial [Gemmatimonadales bacterium]